MLLLVPLALMAMVAGPIGVYRTLGFRHDAVLWMLSLATILMVWLGYGVLVFVLQASWFLARRRRAYKR